MRDEHGLPQDGNVPLGWPKKVNVEEINKFLQPSGLQIVDDKLQAIGTVENNTVVPVGVFGYYVRRRPKNPKRARTPYVSLCETDFGLKMHPACPATFIQLIGQDDGAEKPGPEVNCVFEEDVTREYDEEDRVAVRIIKTLNGTP